MKITYKIIFIVFFLLCALVLNAFVALFQLSKVSNELKDMANQDVLLREVTAAITAHQLERAILFERTLHIAEELAYANPSETRKKYLDDQLGILKKGFEKSAESGALNIIKGRDFLEAEAKEALRETVRRDLQEASQIMRKIEQAHMAYDSLFVNIFQAIKAGHFALSIEDLNTIELKEKSLRSQLSKLKNEIDLFVQQSLQRASFEQKKARQVLGILMLIIFCVSLTVLGVILQRLSRPLKDLIQAVHQVGAKNFAIHLEGNSQDEIGEVSRAFNVMARQLEVFKTELEQKNVILSRHLEVTESQKKDLEKVNKELDSFVHTVSHDIASPLMGIAGYADYIKKHYGDSFDEQGRKCLDGIWRGVHRLSTLIKDLVNLTKISRIKNPYEATSISAIIEAVQERLEFFIKNQHVQFIISPDLPTIRCDRVKIEEVFYNLINNAIKYSSKNEKESPRVEIGYEWKADEHQFFIKDNGVGIDPVHQNEIFDMFKRSPDVKNFEGSGVGLSIVKMIVQEHLGKIWVESKMGHGATFFFTISRSLRG